MYNIKTIIFDYENTLGGTWHGILKHKGLNINAKKFEEFDNSNTRKNFFLGGISENEFLDRFIDKVGANVDKEELKKNIRDAISISPEVFEIAKSLKKRYTLALASDNAKEWGEYLIKKYHLENIFSHFFWSYEMKIRKVSSDFFNRLLKELNIQPSDAIFIDDRDRNIRITSNIGINTILFDNRIDNAYWLKQKINEYTKK